MSSSTKGPSGLPLPPAVYRWFDAEDILLYVGMSDDLATRIYGHSNNSPWMRVVARMSVTRYTTRQEALAAEERAIRKEKPIFNVALNETWEARVRRRDYELKHAEMLPRSRVTMAMRFGTGSGIIEQRGRKRPHRAAGPFIARYPLPHAKIVPFATKARTGRPSQIRVATHPEEPEILLLLATPMAGIAAFIDPDEACAVGVALIEHAQAIAREEREACTTTFYGEGPPGPDCPEVA